MHPLDTIPYRVSHIHHRVAHAFAEVLRTHCAERGKPYVLTPPQWGMMAVLKTTAGQPIGAIGEKLGIDPAALTGTIKRLEQQGLIERVHDHEDRRVVNVSLTAEGQDILRSLEPEVAAFNERLLPDDQRQALFEQLQHLLARISEVVPGMGNRFDLPPEYLWQQDHEHEG